MNRRIARVLALFLCCCILIGQNAIFSFAYEVIGAVEEERFNHEIIVDESFEIYTEESMEDICVEVNGEDNEFIENSINNSLSTNSGYTNILLQVPYYPQQATGDCGISSISMIEAYELGYGKSDFSTVYNSVLTKIKSISGNFAIPSSSSIGYKDISQSLSSYYNQLAAGNPVLIRRAPYEHWSVIVGYNGSSSVLEESGFIVWDTKKAVVECDYNEVGYGRKFDLTRWLKAPNWNGSEYIDQGQTSIVRAAVRTTGLLEHADGIIAQGVSNDIRWSIDREGKLVVEGEGELERDATSAGSWMTSGYVPWNPYRYEIKTAVVKIKNMKNASGLFFGCGNLTSVDLNGFDTSCVTDMSYMFALCNKLEELNVSAFDTSNVINMKGMFEDCINIKILDVTSFNTSKVMNMESMFSGCEKLSLLNVNNFNTSKVISMARMFSRCNSLTSLEIYNFDTSNVYDMESMFFACSSIKKLDLSKFSTNKVENMASMFGFCTSLAELNISNFSTKSVTKMHYMFTMCLCIEELDLNNFDTSNVIYMGSMFSGCSGLKTLKVRNFNTGNVKDMGLMFHDCSSLTSLDIGGFNTSNVTSMDSMFAGCVSLIELDLSSFDTSNVEDMWNMFGGCGSLKSLSLDNFNTAKVTDMSKMFIYCNSLVELHLSNFDTSNVIYISQMFEDCSSLVNIDLSSFDLSKLKSLEEIKPFEGCTQLKLIKTPKNVLTAVLLPYDMVDINGNVYSFLPKYLEKTIFIGMSIEDIFLEEVNEEDNTEINTFKTYRDGWGFAHWYDNFSKKGDPYEILDNDYNRLISGLSWGERTKIKNIKNEPWGGSCFGLSSSALLIFDKKMDLKKIDRKYVYPGDVESLYHNKNGDKDVSSLESMINYYQLSQSINSINKKCKSKLFESESDILEKLINTLANDDTPVIVTLKFAKRKDIFGSWIKEGGHAVVAYDLRKKGNIYSFKVYDCSLGNTETYNVTVEQVNGNYYKYCETWEQGWKSSGYNKIILEGLLTVEDLENTNKIHWKKSKNVVGDVNNVESKYYEVIANYNNCKISCGEKYAIINDGEIIEGDLEVKYIGNCSEIGVLPEYTYILPKLGDDKEYIISSFEAQANNTLLYYDDVHDGFCISIKSDTNGTIIVSSDGTVTTNYDEASEQKIELSKNDCLTDWYCVSVEGKTVGYTLSKNSNDFIVLSTENNNSTIVVNNDFNELCFDNVPTGKSEVIISESDCETCVVNTGNEEIKKELGYSVVFDSNYGSQVDTLTNVKKGTNINRPNDPKKEGFVFAGWYKDDAFTIPWDFNIDRVTSDIVLYAAWRNIENEDEAPKGLWISDINESYIYTGTAIKSQIKVWDNNSLLSLNKDYTVKYSNNVNVGTGKITITGKGNYASTETVEFTILPENISGESFVCDPVTIKSTGKAQKPVPVLMWNNKKLAAKNFTYSITHIWEKRNTPINQDALAYSVLKASHSTFVFAIVADGIGSFQSSELASSYICNRLNAAFKQIVNSNPNASMRFYRNALSRTIFKIHKKLLNFNQDHNLPLGSTCSLIFIKNNRGFTLHYGDSRIYYNNRLLTTDHIDNKGRLVRCIGYGAFHTPQYSSVLIRPASTVTLCTDGYYKRNPHDNSTAIRINVSSTDNYILRRKQKNEH